MDRFPRALPIILHHEGGWANDPQDPGGATMKGVIQRTYDAYRRKVGKPLRSVRHIEDAELHDIYRDGYWLAAKCDQLPAGLDLIVFDCAVNQGPVRARRFLQQSVGAKVDGAIGPLTLIAVQQARPKDAIIRMKAARLAHYQSLPHFGRFGRGWTRRLNEVAAEALKWAS